MDEPVISVPPGARAVVEALVGRAIERCHAAGIALEDFYEAIRAVRASGPRLTVQAMLEAALERARLRGAN